MTAWEVPGRSLNWKHFSPWWTAVLERPTHFSRLLFLPVVKTGAENLFLSHCTQQQVVLHLANPSVKLCLTNLGAMHAPTHPQHSPRLAVAAGLYSRASSISRDGLGHVQQQGAESAQEKSTQVGLQVEAPAAAPDRGALC